MSRFALSILLVALGAGGMYYYQRYSAQPPAPASGVVSLGEPDGGVADTHPGEPASPALELGGGEPTDGQPVGRPDDGAFDLPEPEPLPSAARFEPPPVPPDVLVLGERPEERAERVEATAPNPLMGAGQEEFVEAYESAERAIAKGETDRGFELYRLIFAAAKERSDIRVAAVARKLLEATPDEEKRIEYHAYLARHGSSATSRYRASLAAGIELVERRDAESMRSAWDLLTRAYLAASSREERRAVLDVLEPFLAENVFSRRFTPLLEKHKVGPGDSLSKIAAEYGTTVDAIKRLNGMSSDIVREGQRVLVLSGRPEIHINKSEFRLWLLVGGRLVLERPIGTGAHNSTPEGRFTVRVRQTDPIWYRAGEPPIMPNDPRNILGSRWLGFANTDEVDGIGIHGTPDESSIGKEVSSGCIRMRNADVELLHDFIPRGTQVEIDP